MTVYPEYPLFEPPAHLVGKGGARYWTPREAEDYKNWLLEHLNARTDALLSYFSIGQEDVHPGCLTDLGLQVAKALKSPPFCEAKEGGLSLTNHGLALAADMGLLVARFLLERHKGRIYWEVIKKPKSDIHYNLPVLRGFTHPYLEPVRGSMAEAASILCGKKTYTIWRDSYVFWSEDVPR